MNNRNFGWIVYWMFLVPAASLPMGTPGAAGAEPETYLWIEGENPAEANFQFEVTSSGRGEILSGGQWLFFTRDRERAPEAIPAGGLRLTYRLNVKEAGTYQVWARVGFEAARAPLAWRIGGGEWTDAPAEKRTTSLMEVGHWTEVAWLQLGEAELRPGDASLEIRYTEPGRDGRLLVALDCLALTRGEWVPEGYLKPGERYDAPIDREAAAHVYRLPAPEGPGRTQVELSGLWELARYDDPDMNARPYEPVLRLPQPDAYPLRWMGVEVPGNTWNHRQETVFGHRVIYRTRVDIPAEHQGRGFVLRSWGTNWIVSVFVNGELAGTHRSVWVPWFMDLSEQVRPGEVNEIAVAVKSSYYAAEPTEGNGPMGGRNRPRGNVRGMAWVAPVYPSSKGDGEGRDSGLVNPLFLESAGEAYVEEVFVRPSVEQKRLEADITLRNTTGRPRRLAVSAEAVHEGTGEVERTFEPVEVMVPAGETRTVAIAGAWANPRLWWPQTDSEATADLYDLRTTVSEGNRPVDRHAQRFGFREVTVRGTGIYINGVRRNTWCWVDVRGRPEDGRQWLEAFHSEGSRYLRFAKNRRTSAFLPSRTERLAFYDRHGIPGRLCTMIDGMFISFRLGHARWAAEGEEWGVNPLVWENFREHMAQVARAYRNHPSVIHYQVENELLYINGWNLYRNQAGGRAWDKMVEAMLEVVEAGRAYDGTRPFESGGAGDLSDRLETNSPHYPEAEYDHYPENAYLIEHYSTKAGHWPWERDKPWIVGESRFSRHLEDATIAIGDLAYRGMHDAQAGKAAFLRMLYGGYRWAGVSGWYPWDNLANHHDALQVMQPLFPVPRQQTHRLRAGRKNALQWKIMNDSLSREPVTLEWAYTIGGERIAGQTVKLSITPGYGEPHTLTIDAPNTRSRLDGQLRIRLTQPGTATFEDTYPVPVLPNVDALTVRSPLHVLDRSGAVTKLVARASLEHESLEGLAELRDRRGLLIVGHDTLTPDEAFGRDLLSFAGRGGRVLVLEQDHPVGGANLPVALNATERFGGYAHPQAVGTPVFRDLGPGDLIDWAAGHPTYKNVYAKPERGARSLAEAGQLLVHSPLVEVPAGQGVIVLCQLRVGANLGVDPAADVLLRNLVEHYGSYKPSDGVVGVFAPNNPLLRAAVRETGVLEQPADSVASLLDADRHRVALLDAGLQNLRELLRLRDRAIAFQEAGGWIVLNGLAPDGLETFNRLVGAEHLLRPFRLERVTLEEPTRPEAATLGNRDVALLSHEVIMHGRRWVYEHTFHHVLDATHNAAPFTRPPGAPADPFEYAPTRTDNDPFNYVNGMLTSDFWRYGRQIWWDDPTTPLDLTFELRRPETLVQVNLVNNANYSTIENIELIFDGDEPNALRAVLPDGPDMAQIVLPEPRTVRRTMTIRLLSRRVRGTHASREHLVGIDDVQLLRKRLPSDAVALDSVGGLVVFPQGAGGLLLNQIKFMAEEPTPENAANKVRLMSVLLQNLGAGTAADDMGIPGVNLRYQPLDLLPYTNQYVDASQWTEGRVVWFGADADLRHLPVGEQTFADVTYRIVDFHTAPAHQAIMMGGVRGVPDVVRELPQKVEGIRVGERAEVISFLHTAHVTRPITDDERARVGADRREFTFPEVMRYTIRYEDGESVEVPVVLETHIDHWLHDNPQAMPGALVGWRHRSEETGERYAVLYSMDFENPRPEATIRSIDVSLAEGNHRAVPAVLAISVGRRQ